MLSRIMIGYQTIRDLLLTKETYVTKDDFKSLKTELIEIMREERQAFMIETNRIEKKFKEAVNDIDTEIIRVEEKFEASVKDITNVYEDTISSINKKSHAIARIIDTSKSEIKLMCDNINKDFSAVNAISQRLANMDQQIKALQSSKSK